MTGLAERLRALPAWGGLAQRAGMSTMPPPPPPQPPQTAPVKAEWEQIADEIHPEILRHCKPCDVQWRGLRASPCWNCGQPVTTD